MAEFTYRELEIGIGKRPGPGRHARARLQDLSLEPRRRENLSSTPSRSIQRLRTMVLDALIKIKNETDTTLTFAAPARRRVRLLCYEHRRGQHARLHQGDRDIEGAVRI